MIYLKFTQIPDKKIARRKGGFRALKIPPLRRMEESKFVNSIGSILADYNIMSTIY